MFDLLVQLEQLNESIEDQTLMAELTDTFEESFNACVLSGTNMGLSEAVAKDMCAGLGKEQCKETDEDDEKQSTKKIKVAESLDEDTIGFLRLVESTSVDVIVPLNNILAENFDACVERILKSGRKLRMTSKDGKTKYKNRRRAAEAACAASMAAVFSKRGVSAKAKAGKR